jgi:hypothetical protein
VTIGGQFAVALSSRRLPSVNRARAAKLLTSALALPLMTALLLPASFGVVVCRFGAMMAADDCCAGRAHQERAEDPGKRIETEPCCSVRAVDLGTPLAEQSARVDTARDWVLASAWTIWVDDGLARPAAALQRPAVRALGPPVRVLKQSFLL